MAVRIGGLASNMDTETMIKAILEAEQAQVKTYERQLKDEQAELKGWDKVSTEIAKIENEMKPLLDFTTWDQKQATSSVNIMTASATDKALNTDYSINIDQLATKARVTSNSVASQTADLNYSGTFSVENQDITVVAEDSIEDIAAKINASQSTLSSEEKVVAQVINGTMIIEKANTGERDISLSESGSNNILRDLGILSNTDSGGGNFSTLAADKIQVGKNLTGTINGIDFSRKNNKAVDDLIDGVSMNFSGTGSTQLKVNNDTDAIKTLLKDFVKNYNETIDNVRKLTQYISDSESSTEKDKDGKEIKVETGILQGESIANNYLSRLRGTLMGSIDKNNNQDFPIETLNDLGIWFNDKEGHLEIKDETKLDNALTNNFQELETFVRGHGNSDTNKGIFRSLEKLNENYNDTVSGSVSLQRKSLNQAISEKEKKIKEMYEDLKSYEAKLWEQFSNMETNVARINNSMKFLVNSLGIDDNDD